MAQALQKCLCDQKLKQNLKAGESFYRLNKTRETWQLNATYDPEMDPGLGKKREQNHKGHLGQLKKISKQTVW